MTESDGLHYFDFDWGEFRYAVARYIRILILRTVEVRAWLPPRS